METWRVTSLDVWGNEEDGFEINDWFNVGYIDLPDAATSAAISALIKGGYLKAEAATLAEADECSSEGFIEIREKATGRPVFQLYLDGNGAVSR